MSWDKAQQPPQNYRKEAPPERIGPYRILDVLGEGGMGTVYVAEQKEPIRRRVALKVIKLGMDSEEVLKRFAAERQALAMMEHDNIAKVLDAGTTERGQPYFAMEHVPGVILTEYADLHRLTTSERLELFQQVCDGVQHAHQKGVIHRDLKPSNILVTENQGRPVPKIIDFGVAKATDHRLTEQTVYTREGRIVGTLEYMSPEQADLTAADIDTRTDIYSLGAILYELLVGQLPFSSEELSQAGFIEMQRIIREEEAPRPSSRITRLDANSKLRAKRCRTTVGSLARELRGGLDWIVMHAMEKECNRRYPTAVSLKEDIDRYLMHQPVLAGPPSTAYRLKKFIRRNRLQVIASGVVLLALVAGTIGTSIGFLRAADEAEERAAQAVAAQQERNRAEELTSFMLFDLWDRLEPIGRLDLLEQVALSAKEYYQGRSLDDLTDEARRKLSLSWMNVGNVLHSQGHLEDARSAYSAAQDIQTDLLALDASNATLRADLANSQAWIGKVHHDQGNLERALELYRSAGETLQVLVLQPIPDLELMVRLSHNHSKIADVLKERGDLTGSLAEFRKGLEIQEDLVDRDPGDQDARNDLARFHSNIGVVFRNQGDLGETIKSYQQALDIREALLAANPDNIAWKWDLAVVYNNLGGVLSDRGDSEASISNYRKSLAIREELVAHDPQNTLWKNELAGSYHNWGAILRRQGDLEGTLSNYRKALAIREELVAQDPSNTSWKSDLALICRSVGIVLRDRRDMQGALASYIRALAIQEDLVTRDASNSLWKHDLANVLNSIGILQRRQGDLGGALQSYERASTIWEELVVLDPSNVAWRADLAMSYYNTGNVQRNSGDRAAALISYGESWKVFEDLVEQEPSNLRRKNRLANVYNNSAGVLLAEGRTEDAIRHLRRTLELQQDLVAVDPANSGWQAALARTRANFAQALAETQRHREATAAYSAALEAPANRNDLRRSYLYRAACTAALAAGLADDEEAERLRKQALEWLEEDLRLRTERMAQIERQIETVDPGDPLFEQLEAELQKHISKIGSAKSEDPDLASLREMAEFAALFTKYEH